MHNGASGVPIEQDGERKRDLVSVPYAAFESELRYSAADGSAVCDDRRMESSVLHTFESNL